MKPLDSPSRYALVLALASVLSGCRSEPGQKPGHSEAPANRPLSKISKHFRQYSGSIGGKHPIVMDMTIRDDGHGVLAPGTYAYQRIGKSLEFHGHLADTGFAFELSDAEGGPERFSGRFSSFDSFEGTWTKARIDSAYDSAAGAWKKTRETVSSLPFRVERTGAEGVPVRFDIRSRENDSLARENIAARRIEGYYDSLPSRLSFELLRVDHPDTAVGAGLNRAIARSLLDFYGKSEGRAIPMGPDPLEGALGDFDRLWKASRGAYFDIAYTCDVKADGNGILSVKYGRFADGGGAHPSDDGIFESFDIGTGRKLSLEDLLIPGYEEELGALAGVPNCPKEPDGEYGCEIGGLTERGFALLRDGILFGAVSAGRPEDRRVPYVAMARLIRPDGALARFRPQ